MTVYGYRTRAPNKDYCASMVAPDGSKFWEHLRTNLGRKVAYGMIAKHYEGFARIESFRDETQFTQYDRDGIAQGRDFEGFGQLRKLGACHSSSNEGYATAR